MSVVNVWAGAVTESTARVVAKVTGSSCRLAVADNPAFNTPAFYGPLTPSAEGIVAFTATGLEPSTRYYYAVEDDGLLDLVTTGQLLTHPPAGQPATFTVWLSGDAGANPDEPGVGSVLASDRLSNHEVFDTIRQRALSERWLHGVHLGDLHYYDLGSDQHGITGGGSLANYRSSYDDVLAQPRQHALYRDVPLVYLWDDHDFGPNNSDGTLPTKGNAQQAYRERVPHLPLPDGEAVYQSWQVGRVLFVACDVRSYRDPNTDPQGPSKTMLGEAQKLWMRSVLTAADAALLVWVTSSAWLHPSGVDTWASFLNEQAEIIQMFADTGWLGRMCVVWADRHSLGIDTGTNTPGGMPGFQFAPLDATPSTGATWFDTGDESSQRAQYGTLRFADDGQQVTVTATGWVGSNAWRVHQFTVGEPEPPPPAGPPSSQPPAAAPVAVAVIRNRITWFGCDLLTGRKIAELPEVTGQPSRVLGSYTSADLVVPIPRGGPGEVPLPTALQATTPRWRTMIVAVVNDIPAWAGVVLRRRRGSAATMRLACATLEAYFWHRKVADHAWQQQDIISVIAAGLVGDANSGINGVGQGLGLVVDAPPSGVLRDRSYQRTKRRWVYDELRELMGTGDIEWTIDLDWTTPDQVAVAKIIRLRRRIGTASTTPKAVFMPAGESSAVYAMDEDSSGDRYATWVQAYTSGEGEDQPESQPAVDVDALASGTPVIERHIQPSTSIVDVDVLNAHAGAELDRLRNGAVTWDITARWDAYPRYGVDWQIGDDIELRGTGHGHPEPAPGRPGVTVRGRAIGWTLSAQDGTLSPILLDPLSGG